MTDSPSNDLKKIRERDHETLVAEQVGLTGVIVGVVISLIVGLSFRAAFSDSRILKEVKYAASRVDPRVNFRIEGAHLSLSDGFFPEFAVVVQNIQVDSDNACWLSPKAEANEMKLPIHFWKLVQGELEITQIKLDQVKLVFREDRQNCLAVSAKPLNREVAQLVPSAQSVEPDKEHMKQQSRKAIEKIKIKNLQIQYMHLPFANLNLRNITIDSFSKSPKRVSIRAGIDFQALTMAGDYSSRADLLLKYEEVDVPFWTLTIGGHWREGQYRLLANYDQASDRFMLESDIKYLPLVQLLPILKQNKLIAKDFSAKKVWLSGKLSSAGAFRDFANTPVVFRELKVEGDFGELLSEKVSVIGGKVQFDQMAEIKIKNLDVGSLLSFAQIHPPTTIFSHMGKINGVAKVVAKDKFSIKGEYADLDVLFSRNSSRLNQRIVLFNFNAQINPNGWLLEADQFRLQDALMDGKLLASQSAGQKMRLKIDVDELILSPQVQELITSGGNLQPITLKLNLEAEQGKITSLVGRVRFDGITTPEVRTSRVDLNVVTKNDRLLIDLTSNELELADEEKVAATFLPLFGDSGLGKTLPVTLSKIRTQIETSERGDLIWSGFSAQVEKDKLSSSGAWDKKGRIEGVVNWRSGSKGYDFSISGHKDKPLLQAIK